MKRTKRITVKVTEERHKEWQEYAREHDEYSNVSDMIRTVVAKDRHGALDREAVESLTLDASGGIDSEELIDTIDVAMSDVTERLTRMEREIAEVRNAVGEDDDEIDRLADDIVSQLPVTDDPSEWFSDIESAKGGTSLPEFDDHIDDIEVAKRWSTPEAWAAFYDEDVGTIRRALHRATDYPEVELYEHDYDLTDRRFYRLPIGDLGKEDV